ncbi:outer membrane beta-barrel protein [Cyclonatronum proteinivorum]|nr:outer membrane beta-barrel protein [Cyclonatronum proteinivorum]
MNTKKTTKRQIMQYLSGFLIVVCCLVCVKDVQAQTIYGKPFDLWLGFSVTNQTISYSGSDFAARNDQLDYKAGASLHVHLNWYFYPRLALRTGLTYQFFDWTFKDTEMPQTDETGNPTGNVIFSTMTRGFNIMYLGVPLHIRFHPYADHFYLTAGTDFWYKFRHKTGQIDTFLTGAEDGSLELLTSQRYSTPGFAEDFVIAGLAGLGFEFKAENLKFGVELNARRNLTPFFDRGGVTQNFTQYGLSLSLRL